MPVVMMISPEPVAFFILNSNTRYGQSTHTNIRTTHTLTHAPNTLATQYTQTFLYVHICSIHSIGRVGSLACSPAHLLIRALEKISPQSVDKHPLINIVNSLAQVLRLAIFIVVVGCPYFFFLPIFHFSFSHTGAHTTVTMKNIQSLAVIRLRFGLFDCECVQQ